MIRLVRRLHAQTSEDGFSLIELMIVVVIIGILAAIAIPIFANQQKAANLAALKSDVHNAIGQVVMNTPVSSAVPPGYSPNSDDYVLVADSSTDLIFTISATLDNQVKAIAYTDETGTFFTGEWCVYGRVTSLPVEDESSLLIQGSDLPLTTKANLNAGVVSGTACEDFANNEGIV